MMSPDVYVRATGFAFLLFWRIIAIAHWSLRGGSSRRSNPLIGLEIALPPSAARNDTGEWHTVRRIKMTKLLVRWVIAALAIFVAALIVPGIRVSGTAWVAYAVMAVILGLVNALVRPVLKILTCPLILLTLGLFTLVINGFTFWLSARIANWLGIGFYVDGFWPAFWGALIVSIVSVILSALVKED